MEDKVELSLLFIPRENNLSEGRRQRRLYRICPGHFKHHDNPWRKVTSNYCLNHSDRNYVLIESSWDYISTSDYICWDQTDIFWDVVEGLHLGYSKKSAVTAWMLSKMLTAPPTVSTPTDKEIGEMRKLLAIVENNVISFTQKGLKKTQAALLDEGAKIFDFSQYIKATE